MGNVSQPKEDPVSEDEYKQHYSEESFWGKLGRYAKFAGKEVVEKALYLFYAAQEPGTPAWAKGVIYSALGYFILPADAIPDVVPLVGYADDLGALATALAVCAAYITPDVKAKARRKWQDWFGDESSDAPAG